MRSVLLYQHEWKRTAALCLVDTYTWFDERKKVAYFIKRVSLLQKDKIERIQNEYKVTECMRHNDNFSLIIDYCMDREYMYVLYHDHGVDLMEFGLVDMDDKAKIMGLQQMAELLRELHKYGMVHGDFKLENVLIDARGKIRLCDFESLMVPGNDYKRFGTLEYTSPEQIDGKISLKTDIWAFGVICYCVWYTEFPFCEVGGKDDYDKVCCNIKTMKVPKQGGLLDHLIELCVEKDMERRCGIDVVCECFVEICKKLM